MVNSFFVFPQPDFEHAPLLQMAERLCTFSWMKIRRESFFLKKWRARWVFWDPVNSSCMYVLKERPEDFPIDEHEFDPHWLDSMRKVEIENRKSSNRQLDRLHRTSSLSSSSAGPDSPSSTAVISRPSTMPILTSVSRARLAGMHIEFAERTDVDPVFIVPGSTRIYGPCDPKKTDEEFSFCIDNSQLEPDLREMMGPKPSDWIVDFICPNEEIYRLWMGTFMMVSENAPASLFRDALPISQSDLRVEPTRFVKRESVWSNTPFDHVRITVRLVSTENPRESVWEPIQMVGRPFDTLGVISIRLLEEYGLKVDEFQTLDPRLTLRELADHLGHAVVTAMCPTSVLRMYQDAIMDAGSTMRSSSFSPKSPPSAVVPNSPAPSSPKTGDLSFIQRTESFLLRPPSNASNAKTS